MTARTLMIQGTASSVGKSLMVAALCRVFANQGVRVAPFKSQNMANNAAVTADGLEIGRAQAVQAAACRIAPTVDMNPILLKPETDMRAQVVLQGRSQGVKRFNEYHDGREKLVDAIESSLARLRREYELVIIEGAGSPAEINLKSRDLVNGFVARLADAPVVLVGDIDRGGVFASLLGTLMLLDVDERARVQGLLINKFRGDYSILAPALPMIEARIGKPVLGVVPYLRDVRLPEEDGMDMSQRHVAAAGMDRIEVAVVALPHIANVDDFFPLRDHADVTLRWVDAPRDAVRADLLIVPGTKATVQDLLWLRERKLDEAVRARAIAGLPVLGVCGGCQMLGGEIRDCGVESPNGGQGLGLLPITTEYTHNKTTRQVHARARQSTWLAEQGQPLRGYFIHMGRTRAASATHAALTLEHAPAGTDARTLLIDADGFTLDGAVSANRAVVGTMLHGLFDTPAVVEHLLHTLRTRSSTLPNLKHHNENESPPIDPYDRLATHVESSIDMTRLRAIVGL